MAKYNGIDVSRWQGDINWSLVKNAGIQFAMIRATYGADGLDVYFNTNYIAAKKVGIPVGAYHFAYATTPEQAVQEAENCHKNLNGKEFEYPIAYDMEYNKIAELGKEKVSEIAKAFCEKMESYGYYVCIYANKFWLDNYFTDEIFAKYDIWLAQWTAKPTFERVYGIWQKSSKGRVDGINGYVDLDESYKNYPSIMKFNGLNGFKKANSTPVPGKPVSVKLVAGQKITLKNVKLYATSTTTKEANTVSGDYYVYDGKLINNRYRITNSAANVGKTPVGNYVTGFVKSSDLR